MDHLVPKPRIFISHASSDFWVARQLEAQIRNCGADTFLDCEHIDHGDDFQERIIDVAGDCMSLTGGLSLYRRTKNSELGYLDEETVLSAQREVEEWHAHLHAFDLSPRILAAGRVAQEAEK